MTDPGFAEKIMKPVKILEKYIFPQDIYCIACGAIIDESRTYRLCDSCMKKFRWIRGAACKKCGKALGKEKERMALFGGNAAGICHDCRSRRHFFDGGYSCVSYGELEKKPLMKLKYAGDGYIADTLGEIMYDRLLLALAEDEGGCIPFDLIVPVPLHKKRQALRGYNQAALIGRVLAAKLGLPFYANLLRRVKATEKMSRLGASERTENLEGAFAISGRSADIAGKTILLVDDIYTTGNTADAASAVLKSAGAKAVYIITFASGSNFVPDTDE